MGCQKPTPIWRGLLFCFQLSTERRSIANENSGRLIFAEIKFNKFDNA